MASNESLLVSLVRFCDADVLLNAVDTFSRTCDPRIADALASVPLTEVTRSRKEAHRLLSAIDQKLGYSAASSGLTSQSSNALEALAARIEPVRRSRDGVFLVRGMRDPKGNPVEWYVKEPSVLLPTSERREKGWLSSIEENGYRPMDVKEWFALMKVASGIRRRGFDYEKRSLPGLLRVTSFRQVAWSDLKYLGNGNAVLIHKPGSAGEYASAEFDALGPSGFIDDPNTQGEPFVKGFFGMSSKQATAITTQVCGGLIFNLMRPPVNRYSDEFTVPVHFGTNGMDDSYSGLDLMVEEEGRISGNYLLIKERPKLLQK